VERPDADLPYFVGDTMAACAAAERDVHVVIAAGDATDLIVVDEDAGAGAGVECDHGRAVYAPVVAARDTV
jgi:hypothetical protein